MKIYLLSIFDKGGEDSTIVGWFNTKASAEEYRDSKEWDDEWFALEISEVEVDD